MTGLALWGRKDVQAVQPRQHDVQQSEVGRGAQHAVQRLAPVADVLDFVACMAQVVDDDGGHVGFVFDQEDAGRLHGAGFSSKGSHSVMRRPPSGEAAASMLPPWAWTMVRQMASPRPEPPRPSPSRTREASTR